MRQAIHILKKDIRHLWLEIAVVLAAAGLFTLIYTQQEFWRSKAQLPQTVAAFLVSFLLPVSWFLLIVRAIHGEPLTGDREFWPTRPYKWKSLLAAKLLLIVLFVNLPILAAQATVLNAHGFSLAAQWSSLFWNQLLLLAALFLPMAAIGALTAGMVQVLVTGLAVFAALILLSLRLRLFATALEGGGWGAMDWVHGYYALLVVGLAAPAILIWQYARRRTMAARATSAAVAVVIAIGVPVSWSQAFGIQARLWPAAVNVSSVRAGLNTKLHWATMALPQNNGRVSLSIPLEVTGIPDDASIKAEGLAVTIDAPDGSTWSSKDLPGHSFNSKGQLIILQRSLEESFYRRIKDQPVTIRGELYLTLYGNRRETKVPLTGQRTDVPGMGLCTAAGGPPKVYSLTCYAALRPRAARTAVIFEPHPRVMADYTTRFPPSYSPFPAELSISPIAPSEAYSTYQGSLEAVTVSSEEPVAFVRAPLRIDGLRLGSYEAALK